MLTIETLLSRQTIFSCLNSAQRAEIIQQGFSRRFSKDAFIVHNGDIWPYLFMVTQGSIQAFKESSEGRSLLVATFYPGDVFWGLAFFLEDAPMPVSLQAEELCQVHIWPRAGLLPVMLANGMMSWELACLMVQRMQHASAIVDELAFQPLACRVARLLLEQSLDHEVTPRSLTLEEMAGRIGSTREMVCRMLQRFSNDGLIEVTRTEFVITDRKKLELLTSSSKPQ